MMKIDQLVRPEIRDLQAYASARDECSGNGYIYLDANENPDGDGVNRYPDPLQRDLKVKLADFYRMKPENLFLGNGSDEILDLLMRVFCRPGKDNVVTIDPSYGMYEVLANINQVEVRKVSLGLNYDLDATKLLSQCDKYTRLVILCSPNNPTGNLLNELDIYTILNTFQGMVIIDEAYIEFSESKGFYERVKQFPNLVVLRTFSKAWRLAGIRLGYAFANPEVLKYLNKTKYPYNVNLLTQQKAMDALQHAEEMFKSLVNIKKERERLGAALPGFSFVRKVYPTQANYFLVEVDDPEALLKYLAARKIIVRNRSGIRHCRRCIRITIGTYQQNDQLLDALASFEKFNK